MYLLNMYIYIKLTLKYILLTMNNNNYLFSTKTKK